MKITSCRFEGAAYGPRDEPRTRGPSVIFLGRSNVGKSSLINRLLGTKNLARTSSRPGRTQSVNFYRINESFHFVDLPGYGYAEAPERVRGSWGDLVEGFLKRRHDRIALAVLLIDARHGPTELDRVMKEWLETSGMQHVVAATKADKLSGAGRAAAARVLADWLREREGAGVLVSADTGLGTRELWRHVDRALVRAKQGDRGERWTSAN